MNKAEFERIAAEARANVKALREEEANRLLDVQRERVRRRLELEREAKEQGVALPPADDELTRLMNRIGRLPEERDRA